MMIDTETIVPWKSNDNNENLLVDFLNQRCCWKGAHTYGDKEAFFVAYAEFCRQRGTTSEPRGMTETRLRRMNHEVSSVGIRGVFVRAGAEDPAPATQRQPTLAEKLSMPVTPGLIEANNPPQPTQPEEVIFTSALPAM